MFTSRHGENRVLWFKRNDGCGLGGWTQPGLRQLLGGLRWGAGPDHEREWGPAFGQQMTEGRGLPPKRAELCPQNSYTEVLTPRT